ncbi:MAG TPA: cation-translocating P-type ATPase [Burkholderiales bacterium]|nr:cation-translocating P-type ATPase [Burkholderiales bacterium]
MVIYLDRKKLFLSQAHFLIANIMTPLSSKANMSENFPQGLTQDIAKIRLAAEGPNEIATDQRRTTLDIAIEVAREPMFLLLLVAGGIYYILGDAQEALILLGFVIIIMTITILQENRTENILETLRDLSSPRALVIRNGTPTRIAGREVVREDILILVEGDRVPADGMVMEAHELAADESMLTGESETVPKFSNQNQVFAGTLIVRGQGLIKVSSIGRKTELGRIGKSLQDITSESSPLQDEVGLLARRLALIAIGLSLALTVIYWIFRHDWLHGLLAGITLAMSLLPQEIPVIMIIFFALGARRIANQKVLTRRLHAIETLGETTVLCVDKTGTLTENHMTIAALSVGGKLLKTEALEEGGLPDPYHELLEYAVLASEIDPHDPMELAFHHFAKEYLANTEHLHPDWSLTREYEISPRLLAMSHLWRNHSDQYDVAAAKGAPEAISDLCHMTIDEQLQVNHDAEIMADQGLRVLGVAKANHSIQIPSPESQHDFSFKFVGLVGLADPLRAEVPDAITECHQAGIRVIMITGDHPRTARAIAASAGIPGEVIITGNDMEKMDTLTLARQIASVHVFARVTPAQKLAIVEALKKNGEIVAMTGDGVNDAPALKSAHIGIAMGKRGTDVAREAASLILLEDDFTAILSAIRLGRRIFANLRQAMVYTLAVHVPIIGLSILPLMFGLPLILTPIHIAFLELVIDPSCSLTFEAETANPYLMEQPPRSATEPLVSSHQLTLSLIQGLLVTLAAMAYYSWAISKGEPAGDARTLAFIILVTANSALILPTRSPEPGWLRLFSKISSTGIMVLGATLMGLMVITEIPVIAQAFSFSPPTIPQWLSAFLIGASMLILFEWTKLGLYKRPKQPRLI